MKKLMKIEGMMCPHCEARVKSTLEGLAGVDTAEVSHTAGTALVTLNQRLDNDTLKAAVEQQGYRVTEVQ